MPNPPENPGASGQKRLRWLGPLAGPLMRFLDAPASADPFYLTNRTFGQKMRLGAAIALPCGLVMAGIVLAVTGVFDRPAPPPPAVTPQQIAEKMLPDLANGVKIQTNHDLEISDVHVEQGGGPRVTGTVRNNTSHVIQNAELVFDLTDASGSRLGAVSTHIVRVEGNSTAPFSFPVEQKTAAFVLVREVREQ